MNTRTQTAARPVSAAAPAGLARLRRGSLAVLVLIVIEFGIGMYVNLYVAVPKADHGGGVGGVLSNGPATLSIHVVIGLLLGLGALGVLVQAVMSRQLGAVIASALGVFALVSADATGASFTTGGGHPADSMGMAVLTGVALLCYATNLYLVRPSALHG